MFSPIRALLRRYAIAHFMVMTFVFVPFVLLTPHKPFSSGWGALWVGMQVPWLLLIVDTLVVFYYTRRINRVAPMNGLKEALLYGATWKGLRKMAGEVKNFTRDFATIEKAFPELRNDREYAAAMGHRDYLTAQRIFERIKYNRAQAARAADRKARKDMVRNEELARLLHEAREFGAPESIMHDAETAGIDAVRTVVTRFRRRAQLLRDSDSLHCRPFVEGILAEHGIEVATAVVARVHNLSQRAKVCGAESELLLALASDSPERSAEEVVSKAERAKARLSEEDSLRRSIAAVREPLRSELLAKLEALRLLQYGSREFRKAKYAIENALDF